MPVTQLSEEEMKYDMKQADKKQREVAYLAQFLHKDISYSIKDVEKIQAGNDRKAKGASEQVKK